MNVDQITLRTYTVLDVSELLGIHENTVYGMISDGRLPAVKVGARYRILHRDLEDWLEGQRVAPLRVGGCP